MREKSTRGRKPIPRSLPPIAETCAAFKGFAADESRVVRIFEVLAAAIQHLRRAVPQPFYAMRDVAAFFKVSLNTTAKVYRRLDREGALTLVRSSHSIITPRAPRTRLAVRGVVCMPVWLPGFLCFLDWRQCVAQMEEEFTPYHFVAEPIFYQYNEEVHPAFVDRLLKYNPDYILWYCPNQDCCNIMLSLVDAGVPVIVIQDGPGNYPGKSYRLSYERGFRLGLKEWATSGEVDDIVVPQRGPIESAIQILLSTLPTYDLPSRFIVERDEFSLLDSLRPLAPRTALIFDDDFFYTWLCARAPEVLFELCKKHRVLVARKVALLRTAALPDLTVDTLFFPWKKLARRIAMDVSKGKGSLPSEEPVFEAEWRSRSPLSEALQNGYLQ